MLKLSPIIKKSESRTQIDCFQFSMMTHLRDFCPIMLMNSQVVKIFENISNISVTIKISIIIVSKSLHEISFRKEDKKKELNEHIDEPRILTICQKKNLKGFLVLWIFS